ncbi:hypothetical protein GYMLUDRAFT_48274 [Collybiopsis luxurians FD-317 M1]|uniref:HMG box domain-containing protein n=1 Tax=Collybiopsis luxurians FD-317 M1 TaxID=944289 RepID=A0A0D0AWD0_9AGAR|nr:hypothetical protein GYMLUDRAFT_48274 [Collybiopsis luxurians FD-317 M1]
MPALRTRDTQSRPLEVTTDAPQLPALTIVSPTPRAFTFPITHNLDSSDSPYSTPSNSPFEPDLNSLAISSSSSCTTPPPLMRTLSPTSSFTSVSPSPTSITSNSLHSQKSPGSDVERRPRKGDEDYIKRPENAFILFRRKCCEERQAAEEEVPAVGVTKKQRQADLSKTISQQWKSLAPEERKYWEDLAKEKKKEHALMYPGYVYRPQRVRDKDGKARNKKRKTKTDSMAMLETGPAKDPESMSFIIAPPRQHGRSASAPTPPPMSYQSIQIPNLYSSSPSCPTSPSLLPMISRRATHSGNLEDVMADFDFTPSNEHLLAPAFSQEQSNFQSSEFLRNMFNMPPSSEPLTISTEPSMLLPAHHIVSPASTMMDNNSSGPSSPATGPFTPTLPMHPHPGFDLAGVPNNACAPDSQLQDMQMQMSSPEFDFSGYSWPTSSVWQDEPTSGIMNNDFDLSSIPSLEIGASKFIEEPTYMASPEAMGIAEYSQEYSQEYPSEYMADYQQGYGQLEHGQYLEGHQSTESSLLGYDNLMGSSEQSF